MPTENQSVLPPNRQEVLRRLLGVCVALAISAVATELLWVNRFLRDIIQIQMGFGYFLALLLVTIWIFLFAVFKGSTQFKTESLAGIMMKGVGAGILGSVVAISGTPLLQYGSLASTIYVWKRPLYFIYAIIFSFGWLYGGLAGLALFFFDRRRYLYIGLLVGTCAVIGILERVPIVRWIIHRWTYVS